MLTKFFLTNFQKLFTFERALLLWDDNRFSFSGTRFPHIFYRQELLESKKNINLFDITVKFKSYLYGEYEQVGISCRFDEIN